MADIIITPGTIEIGSNFTPSTTTHKYITLSNVNVTGKIAIPQTVTSLRLGTSSQITSATTITSAFSIIDPGSVAVDQTLKKLKFDIFVQVKYNTPTFPGVDFVETKEYSAEATITFPAGMNNFVLASTFVPFIQTVGTAAVVETTTGSGVYVIEVPVTLGAFNINASGITSVNVPLAIE